MNKNQLQHFRQHLEEERALVTSQLHEQAASLHARQEREVGDKIDDSARSTQVTIADSEDMLLKKIQLALKRIDDGVYGTCVVCSTSIPLERLHANPSALHCIHCQETIEAR